MPIEFNCRSCSAKIRCPDDSAGKKGKCPTCGNVMQIPAAAPTPQPSTAASGSKISLRCPSCDKALSVPPTMAGKQGKCPSCQSVIQIPAAGAPQPQVVSAAPIQFNCPACGKTLKTPASSAGSQGKCPHCQGVFQVPAAGSASQTEIDGLTPVDDSGFGQSAADDPFGNLSGDPLGGGQDPFGLGALPAGGQFPAAAPTPNPYSAPTYSSIPAKPAGGSAAQSKVMGPAISLIVVSSLSVLLLLLGAAMQFATGQLGKPPPDVPDTAATRISGYVGAFLLPVLHAAVLAGSISMLRMKSYGAAMTAAVLSVIPCCSPCLLLGIPFGIWALVVLNSADVKRAFT